MRTEEQILKDLNRVLERRASGVVQVTYGDKTLRYDVTNDTAVEAALRAELALIQGAPVTTRMSFTRIGMRRY